MDKEHLRIVLEKVALGTMRSQDAAKELGIKNSRFHEIKRSYGIKRPAGLVKLAREKAEANRVEREHVAQLVADGLITFREGVLQLNVGEATLRRWVAKVKAENKGSGESSGS